ncbi:MAG: hypothetical protein AAF449_08455 [Myxococcota bacterium]
MESSITIEAPPMVVFRFYAQLDHLRFVSTEGRREWCPEPDQVRYRGGEFPVEIQQGRHRLGLRFRTLRLDIDRAYEDEFISWPLKGARHVQTFEPMRRGAATEVVDTNHWVPPWYARPVVARHIDEQRHLFAVKLGKAKALIEQVYALKGPEAFSDGIFTDAETVGVSPIVPFE